MTSNDVEQRVSQVLADIFDLDPSDVGSDTSVDTVDGWDSLQQLTLILALEEEFGVQFGDDETVVLTTYPLIVAFIKERLAAVR